MPSPHCNLRFSDGFPPSRAPAERHFAPRRGGSASLFVRYWCGRIRCAQTSAHRDAACARHARTRATSRIEQVQQVACLRRRAGVDEDLDRELAVRGHARSRCRSCRRRSPTAPARAARPSESCRCLPARRSATARGSGYPIGVAGAVAQRRRQDQQPLMRRVALQVGRVDRQRVDVVERVDRAAGHRARARQQRLRAPASCAAIASRKWNTACSTSASTSTGISDRRRTPVSDRRGFFLSHAKRFS